MARAVIMILYAVPLVLALGMLFFAAIRSFRARRTQQPQESVRRAQALEWYLKRQLLWSRIGQEVVQEGSLPQDAGAFAPTRGDGLKALLRKKYALNLLMERRKAEHVSEMEALGGSLNALDKALHDRTDHEFDEVFVSEGLSIPEEYT